MDLGGDKSGLANGGTTYSLREDKIEWKKNWTRKSELKVEIEIKVER